MTNTQSGNALWLILISIVLLGVVTAMFVRSGGTSDDTGDYEREAISATEIMRYAKSLELGIQNLITRGCSENDISFWNDSNGDGTENASDDYYNAASPSDRSCHVFRAEGAGLTAIKPKTAWFDSTKSSENGYGSYLFFLTRMNGPSGGTDNVGTTLPELTVTVPYITKSLCLALNTQLNIDAIANDAPTDSFYSFRPLFTGSYSATFTEVNFSTAQTAGCIKNSGSPNEYSFFSTLITR